MTSTYNGTLEQDFDAWATMQPGASARRWDLYRRLRHEAPRLRQRGKVYLSTFDDCRDVLGNATQFRNGFDPHGPAVNKVMTLLNGEQKKRYAAILDHQQRWLTSRNGSAHSNLRGLANRVFTPRAINDMKARIQLEIDTRLEDLTKRDSVEIISEFAFHLPMTIISEMLDIPKDLRESIHQSWIQMTGMIGADAEHIPMVVDEAYRGMKQLESRMREVMNLRRGSNTTDLLARLLAAQEDEQGVATEEDIVGIVTQMVIAGHQTTQDTLGSALYELLSDREQWNALCEDQTLIPNTVEEVLRFRTPGQMIGRTVTVKVQIGDLEVTPGEQVVCLLASANRDEAMFKDSDSFDIERENAKLHLAFSRGAHFCLGAALSRMEVTSFLTTLAQRFPDIRLLSENVEWLPNNFLLGVRELHVNFGTEKSN